MLRIGQNILSKFDHLAAVPAQPVHQNAALLFPQDEKGSGEQVCVNRPRGQDGDALQCQRHGVPGPRVQQMVVHGPILLEAVLIPGGCGDARVLELHRPKHRAGVVRVPDRHLPRPGPALRVLVRADHKQVPAVVQHGLPDAALPQAVHGQTQGEALPGCARIQTDSRKIKRHGPRIPVQADVLIAHPVQHRPDALRRGDPGRLGQKIPQLYHRPHRGVECSAGQAADLQVLLQEGVQGLRDRHSLAGPDVPAEPGKL